MNLSFAGCGFLGIYHVGVAVCFRKYAPHLLLNKISGASAGAIAACCLLCDLPLGEFTSDVLRVATEARSKSLGPFNPSFNIQNILIESMEKVLPEDAHLRVNGKLHISLTRVRDGKNVIVSQFDSREDLKQALLASAFIPLFSGILPPKFHGVRYMDGGFSDNLPTLDENTITVSPFCGESDICPRDDSMQLFHINVANTSIELSRHNIYRIARILFPPKPEVLSNMCKQGFDDALRFLHRNNLINCTRCLAVQSTYVVSETLEECMEYDPQCHECKIHRQEALVSNLPDTVMTIFQDAIDSANKGLVNWMFKYRGMKLLSVLSLPYVLPCDMMYATFTNMIGDVYETRSLAYKVKGNLTISTNNNTRKCTHSRTIKRFMASAPVMGNNLLELSKYFMDQLGVIVHKVNKKTQQLSAKISCHLAITEYGSANPNFEANQEESSQMNLNFTLNLDDSDLPLAKSPNRKFVTNKILSRKPSMHLDHPDAAADDDTFEHILQVTAHHEAVMMYYYLDENNKVKVTEIFDVSESDMPFVQTEHEKEVNKQLEFDDDWDDNAWSPQEKYANMGGQYKNPTELSDYSIDDILDRETNLFSDPESEWSNRYTVEEPDDDLNATGDTRPESDQPFLERVKKPYTIPSINIQTEF